MNSESGTLAGAAVCGLLKGVTMDLRGSDDWADGEEGLGADPVARETLAADPPENAVLAEL